jgi:hypothetical protein
MHSRQRYPLNGHMGPYMMGPGPFGGHQQQMMNPYGGNGPMMGLQQPMNGGRHMMGQMQGRGRGRGQGRRNGGGLLSKILGGKKQSNQLADHGGMRAASTGTGGVGSILQTLSNPESISGFLNNTQQVLNTVQSIGPMIQQYGPIVKNLPMMWKLYKGFKDLPTEEKVEETATETPIKADKPVLTETEPVKTVNPEKDQTRNRPNRTSTPKLYI